MQIVAILFIILSSFFANRVYCRSYRMRCVRSKRYFVGHCRHLAFVILLKTDLHDGVLS